MSWPIATKVGKNKNKVFRGTCWYYILIQFSILILEILSNSLQIEFVFFLNFNGFGQSDDQFLFWIVVQTAYQTPIIIYRFICICNAHNFSFYKYTENIPISFCFSHFLAKQSPSFVTASSDSSERGKWFVVCNDDRHKLNHKALPLEAVISNQTSVY